MIFWPVQRISKFGTIKPGLPVAHRLPELGTGSRFNSNHQDNAATYDKDEVRLIKFRIKDAAKKHGVEIEAE
jgi:hypothetical protein